MFDGTKIGQPSGARFGAVQKKALFREKIRQKFGGSEILPTFATQTTEGAIAQLVEQRTENPCVLGSIPSGTT